MNNMNLKNYGCSSMMTVKNIFHKPDEDRQPHVWFPRKEKEEKKKMEAEAEAEVGKITHM